MIYCINPWCPGEEHRQNLIDASSCQYCGTDLLINGRFHLLRPLRQLSHDDNYQIFEIKDTTNKKRRVLKTQIRRNPILDRLFEQEKRLLLNMNERTLPRGIDSFSVSISNPERRELPCLIMEYIDGKNLEDWIRDNGKIGSTRSSREAKTLALDLLEQLTNILSSIHQKDVIHRDIKPSNIMLIANGEGRKELALIDFGIAKNATPGVQGTLVEGSWGYTPLEVRQGEPVFQSDFYALGKTFVYLLTKKHPHEYGNQLQVWNKDTVFPHSGIIKLINDLMRERPEDRPQSTEVILERIEEIRARELQQRTIFPLNLFWLRDTLAVIGLVAILGAILVFLGYLIGCQDNGCRSTSYTDIPPPPPTQTEAAEELISWGEKSIYYDLNLTHNHRKLKTEGIAEFQKDSIQGYQEAEKKFNEIINTGGKDPEVYIFRNNAIVRQKKNNKPIYTIAVVTPITNVNDMTQNDNDFFAQGQQILFGVAQAQTKAIESEKINLEVVIANDRNLKEQAGSIADKLSEMTFEEGRSILAVIGHYASDVTCAALKKYDQNLVVISPSSSVSELRTRCGHKAFFRTASSVQLEAQSLANYVENLNLQQPKIAVLYNKEDKYSEDLFKEFKSKLPRNLTVEIPINLNDSKFKVDDILNKIGDSDIIALFPDGATDSETAYKNAKHVLKKIDKFNKVQKILGSNPLLQYGAITDNNKLSTKFVLATDWFAGCGNRTFTRDANQKWGGTVNRLTALSYEAVQVLFPIFRSQQSQQSQKPLSRGTLFQEIQKQNQQSPLESDVFNPRYGIKTISFDLNNGDRNEIKKRLLVTVTPPDPNKNTKTNAENKQFQLLQGCTRQSD
ncbi:hypothetical protein B4U84_22185 [Westiellopsis prolifica IICB1]|nr:hypothetical protein B4U84_22185 [Westiellopsis prolifica IICB1]